MANQSEEKIITFENYYDVMLAHIVRTKLEDNGIPCFISDENTIAANPIYNQAIGGIKLKIFERDLERCRQIMAEEGDMHNLDHIEIDEETNNAVICTYCASTNIGSTDTGKFASILSAVFPFYNNKAWHCFNCQQDFE
ncbi:DUF2007 domain-containing protein [Mucilaginibacter dorajii]|uniref:DUF2007 domain-containing protein n=1 Tax=Mucilaginibacter dorajii TaxID=692994 RepID=A0ABP7PX16_9SPHI|nr:DUF2007 domain-containing protein [Mucilaginibacter dorajii]MCS3737225.1 hypothetical protein [Mucilaginibacter dorajii]